MVGQGWVGVEAEGNGRGVGQGSGGRGGRGRRAETTHRAGGDAVREESVGEQHGGLREAGGGRGHVPAADLGGGYRCLQLLVDEWEGRGSRLEEGRVGLGGYHVATAGGEGCKRDCVLIGLGWARDFVLMFLWFVFLSFALIFLALALVFLVLIFLALVLLATAGGVFEDLAGERREEESLVATAPGRTGFCTCRLAARGALRFHFGSTVFALFLLLALYSSSQTKQESPSMRTLRRVLTDKRKLSNV